MAVRSYDELMSAIKAKIGDDTSDDSIALIEDFTDTYNSLTDSENWKAKYEENDAMWRQKYKDRFFSAPPTKEKEQKEKEEKEEVKGIDDLFNKGV